MSLYYTRVLHISALRVTRPYPTTDLHPESSTIRERPCHFFDSELTRHTWCQVVGLRPGSESLQDWN